MKLLHEFEVPASPTETMQLLLDAERVVPCLPGAALVEVVDDGTWKTTMSVKLGPVGLDFLNEVRIVEQDDAAGTVRLAVKGRDKRGKGGADATVDARMVAHDGGRHLGDAGLRHPVLRPGSAARPPLGDPGRLLAPARPVR